MLLGNSIKNVFVSGGAGFIGSHVVDILISQDYQVTVYDDLSNGRREFIEHHFQNKNFKFHEANILEMDELTGAMKGHDLVWHLAANTDIIGGYDKPRRDLMDCVVGTFNILESMKFSKIKPIEVINDIGIKEHDQEGRVITMEFKKYYLVTVYTPNSKRELLRIRLSIISYHPLPIAYS